MKYKSSIITEGSGKLGGQVYAKNRNGAYIRNKVSPKQPRTAAQVGVRATFTTLSKDWRGLTDAQRLGWTNLAAQVTLHDTIGNSYQPTGQQLFVSCNANLASVNLPPVSDAPGHPDTVAPIGAFTVTANAVSAQNPTGKLTVTTNNAQPIPNLLVLATAQTSVGRTFFGKSQYRIIDRKTAVAAGAQDEESHYAARFGNPAVGSKISVRLISVSANGFATRPERADTVVAA